MGPDAPARRLPGGRTRHVARRRSPALTDGELRLMQVLWDRGRATVGDVVDGIPGGEKPAYNTVLTILRILEKKGYITHEKDGRAHVYMPLIDQDPGPPRRAVAPPQPILRRLAGTAGVEPAPGRPSRSRRTATRARVARRATSGNPGTVAMDALAAWLWQGSVVTLAVAAGLRLLPRVSAATRHLAWWLTLCSVVALPVAYAARTSPPAAPKLTGLTSWNSASALFARRARPGDARVAGPGTDTPGGPSCAGVESVASRSDADTAPGESGSGAPVTTAAAWTLPAPPDWAVAVALGAWLGFVALSLVRVARGVSHVRRLARRAVPMPQSREARLRLWTSHRLAGRPVTLRVSRDVRVPCALGLGPATILVPRGLFARIEDGALDQLVMHERAHLQRYDDWTRLAEALVSSVAGIHPAVGWIARQIDLERETACDDLVVQATGDTRTVRDVSRHCRVRDDEGGTANVTTAGARRVSLARPAGTAGPPAVRPPPQRDDVALARAPARDDVRVVRPGARLSCRRHRWCGSGPTSCRRQPLRPWADARPMRFVTPTLGPSLQRPFRPGHHPRPDHPNDRRASSPAASLTTPAVPRRRVPRCPARCPLLPRPTEAVPAQPDAGEQHVQLPAALSSRRGRAPGTRRRHGNAVGSQHVGRAERPQPLVRRGAGRQHRRRRSEEGRSRRRRLLRESRPGGR